MRVKIKYHTDITPLKPLDQGDWIDLRASEDMTLYPGGHYLIPLGISVELPEGYEAHIAPRSSTFKNWGILQTNSIGIIDNSYSGDNDIWMMSVYATRYAEIKKNDRVCQFRIVKKQPSIDFHEVRHLAGKDRGGFGSTGVN